MWKELQREPLNHKKKGQGEGEMEIIGLGKPVKDFLITLQKMPPEDQGTWLDDYSSQCGGKVATAIVAAARLGMQTAMCGVVGSDGKGDAIIEDFAYHNVDTTYVIREEGKTSPYCICIAEKESESRRFLADRGTAGNFDEEQLDFDYIKKAKAIHLENGDAASRKAAAFARENHILVSMDADSYTPQIEEMEELCDIFIGSAFYFNQRFQGKVTYKEGLLEIAEKGCSVVIFTQGSKGCVGIAEGEYFELPAYRNVPVVDTTGAGDVFHGAFLSAYLNGFKAEESARFASAVSAIKITKIGGRAGIPDWKMTMHFMDTGKIERENELDERVQYYRRRVL